MTANKYSDAEIKRRAQMFVQADRRNDKRASLSLMKMSLVTGLNTETIRRKIYALGGY